MVLLAAAGIGIAALLTDLIAVRLGSAALAGLPLLLLFTEPFTLSVSRGFLGTTVAFCVSVAGYLALLSSEGRDRIREWEHPNPSGQRRAGHADPGGRRAAGRVRLGRRRAVPAAVHPRAAHHQAVRRRQPGIGGSGGGGGGSGAGNGVGFPDPNTQLSQELHDRDAVERAHLHDDRSPHPTTCRSTRSTSSPTQGWQLFGQPESLVPVSPRLPAPPGLTATSSAGQGEHDDHPRRQRRPGRARRAARALPDDDRHGERDPAGGQVHAHGVRLRTSPSAA